MTGASAVLAPSFVNPLIAKIPVVGPVAASPIGSAVIGAALLWGGHKWGGPGIAGSAIVGAGAGMLTVAVLGFVFGQRKELVSA